MLKVEKRHTADCVAGRQAKNPSASEYDNYSRCTCSYRAIGMLGGAFIRKTLKTSNYEKAVKTIHQWESDGQPVSPIGPVTVERAVTAYLEDAKARNLEAATLSKLKTIFEKQLLAFCRGKGFTFLKQITDVSVIRDFRGTWKDAPLARSKKQGRVISFFYFCERTGWIDRRNPITSRAVGRIRVEQKPTDYFTPAEFDTIIEATHRYHGNSWEEGATGTQLRALTLLMRWTGLRIRDAVTLERTRVTKTDRGGDCILLYQAKTGEPVYCPIPPHVTEALTSLPPGASGNSLYFFWSGEGHPNTAGGNWRRSYRRLFKLAELGKRAHSHMFRDTFAVECLRSGVSLERVSTLLGHKSVKITEKHYKPHVKALQWELEDEVQKSWGTGPKIKAIKRKNKAA
jgi:integrase/recombinase XerD